MNLNLSVWRSESCLDTLNKWEKFSDEEKKKYPNINIQANQALVECLNKIIANEKQQLAVSPYGRK